MAHTGVRCDRCGTRLSKDEAWTVVQNDVRSMLCSACALEVGPDLAGEWSAGTELIPPPQIAREPRGGQSREVAAAQDDLSRRHPVLWFLGSILGLVLALAPFVFFYWLATR